MNSARTSLFGESLDNLAGDREGSIRGLTVIRPKQGNKENLELFHSAKYVDFVRASSASGEGYLDFPDTPAFSGMYEASLYTVGSTLYGLEMILNDEFVHFFNPVGGLHHAWPDRASGFCIFNDAAIAISQFLHKNRLGRIAYVDIDAHHGDGVFYGFESDPRVIIADIHEDGRSLFPGTGHADETGTGPAVGTKLNLPLPPGSGDAEFIQAFDRVLPFLAESEPDLILLQCGADGLQGDPLTHLRYSSAAHAYATGRLHELAHKFCEGRILAMGGGGYDARNVDEAWSAVVKDLSDCH